MSAVSVMIPVYNGERYIRAAVESILNQTFADFELIIVDDGSSDGTASILAGPPISTDSRVRVIRHKTNRGLSCAHNTSLEAAKGDLIARMDGDDIAYPDRLEQQVRYMREHPECVLLGSAVDVLCPAGLKLFTKHLPCDHETITRRFWSGDSQAVMHPAAMMRREAMQRVGGYREEFASVEDIDLYLRLLPHGCVANLPEPLLGYRQHPESTNSRKYDTQVQLMAEMIAELKSQCPDERLTRTFGRGWPRETRLESLLRWGWNAQKQSRLSVARAYAAEAIRIEPLSTAAWRLVYCIARDAIRARASESQLEPSTPA